MLQLLVFDEVVVVSEGEGELILLGRERERDNGVDLWKLIEVF